MFFEKCHFGGHFLRFLRLGKIFGFLMFGVSGLHGALQEVVGRETLQNKGFRSNFAFCLVHLRWTRCIASMLHKFFEINSWGLTNLFFRKIKFLTNLARLSRIWIRLGPVARNGLAAAVRRVFPSFRGSSFDTVFANLKRDLLKLPSLLLVFCSFLRFLLGFGSTQPCTCLWGQLALSPSFFLFVCLQKHCFTP